MVGHAEAERNTEEAHKQIKELKDDVKTLKSLETRRAIRMHSEVEQNDAAMKSFVEKCLATVVAWVTSQTFFAALLKVFGSVDSVKEQRVFARASYALLISFVAPTIGWRLRGLGPCKGKSPLGDFKDDFLKLTKASMGMMLAWGWKDAMAGLLDLTGLEFWDELIVAIVFTLIVALAEMIPAVSRAKKAVHDGGAGDTLVARWLILPTQLGLTAGYAWDQVAIFGVDRIQSHMESPNLVFLTQLVYYLVMSTVIIWLTLRLTHKNKEVQKEAAELTQEAEEAKQAPTPSPKDESKKGHSVNSSILSMEAHAKDLEWVGGAILVSSLSFVYAWGLSNTLNDYFFTLNLSCKSATSCSEGSNAAFALLLTVIFAWLAMRLQTENRESEWGKTSKVLQSNAGSLSVGWAWMNYSSVALTDIKNSTQVSGEFIDFLFMLVSWVLVGVLYHNLMRQRRMLKMQRDAEAAELDAEFKDASV